MYKNPRLKHVEKIKDICSRLSNKHPDLITDLEVERINTQCNLLLETKNVKKQCKHDWRCEKTSTSFVVCDKCGAMKSSIPTPKQSTEKCEHVCCNTMVTFEGETKKHEQTTCFTCGTIISEANYPSPQPEESCKQVVNEQDAVVNDSKQPEIAKMDYENANFYTNQDLVEVINILVDQVNKLTKTK